MMLQTKYARARVLSAGAPGEAMGLAEEHASELQLLVTDVILPEMNGADLADRLQTLNPGMKVLFMSGYTADVIAQRGVLDQGTAFIGKPFKRDDLARKVRDVLEAHEPASQEAATTEHVARQAAAKTGTP